MPSEALLCQLEAEQQREGSYFRTGGLFLVKTFGDLVRLSCTGANNWIIKMQGVVSLGK